MVLANDTFGKQSYRDTALAMPLADLMGMPTIASDSHRGNLRQTSVDRQSNKSGGKVALDSGRSSLHGMLQTVKHQITSSQQQRRTSQQATNYKVVGRAVSPPVKTRDASIQHSAQHMRENSQDY